MSDQNMEPKVKELMELRRMKECSATIHIGQ